MAKKKEVPADEVTEFERMSKVREEITEILTKTERVGMEDLLSLMGEQGFFTAPASSSPGKHSAEAGGLAQHSLNVYRTAGHFAYAALNTAELDLNGFWNSLAIVCLLHDLGKMGDHGQQFYVPNILKSGKQSDAKPWERNKALPNVPHAFRSVIIAERWIDLTPEEEYAIMYHDGLYDRETGGMAVVPGNETKLLMLLHFADLWSARIIEGSEKEDE